MAGPLPAPGSHRHRSEVGRGRAGADRSRRRAVGELRLKPALRGHELCSGIPFAAPPGGARVRASARQRSRVCWGTPGVRTVAADSGDPPTFAYGRKPVVPTKAQDFYMTSGLSGCLFRPPGPQLTMFSTTTRRKVEFQGPATRHASRGICFRPVVVEAHGAGWRIRGPAAVLGPVQLPSAVRRGPAARLGAPTEALEPAGFVGRCGSSDRGRRCTIGGEWGCGGGLVLGSHTCGAAPREVEISDALDGCRQCAPAVVGLKASNSALAWRSFASCSLVHLRVCRQRQPVPVLIRVHR